jgi:hypothetical protein
VAAPDCADRGCCVSHAPPHLLFLLFCGPSQSCGVLLAAVVVCLCGVVGKEGEGAMASVFLLLLFISVACVVMVPCGVNLSPPPLPCPVSTSSCLPTCST